MHGAYLLGDGVEHGVYYVLGVLVAFFHIARDCYHVVGAEISRETSAAAYHLLDLLLCVFSAEAHRNELACRKRARTLC